MESLVSSFRSFFVVHLQVYDTKSPKRIRVRKNTRGQLLSFQEISCVLPNNPLVLDGNPSKSKGIPARAFYIKVSNDGSKFSVEEGLIIIYDSRCMQCTKNGTRTCNLKVGAFVHKLDYALFSLSIFFKSFNFDYVLKIYIF